MISKVSFKRELQNIIIQSELQNIKNSKISSKISFKHELQNIIIQSELQKIKNSKK